MWKKTKNESLSTKKETDYVISFKFISSQFCCLPKVHKSEIIKNVITTGDSEYIQVHCTDDLKGRSINIWWSTKSNATIEQIDWNFIKISNSQFPFPFPSYLLRKKRELIAQRFIITYCYYKLFYNWIAKSCIKKKKMFYLMITCTFSHLVQQWAQNVLPRVLV